MLRRDKVLDEKGDFLSSDISLLSHGVPAAVYNNRQVRSALLQARADRSLGSQRLANVSIPGQKDYIWRSFNQGVRGIVMVPSSVTYAGTVPVQVTWPTRYDPEMPFIASYQDPKVTNATASGDWLATEPGQVTATEGGGSETGYSSHSETGYIASILLNRFETEYESRVHPFHVDRKRINNPIYDLEKRSIDHLTRQGSYLESHLGGDRPGLIYYRVPFTTNPSIKEAVAEFFSQQTKTNTLRIFMTSTQQFVIMHVKDIRVRKDKSAGICLCDMIKTEGRKADPTEIEDYLQSLEKKRKISATFEFV